MDDESALRDLESSDVPTRLAAARYFARNPTSVDLDFLKQRLRIEPDELVSRVLDRAVRTLDTPRAEPERPGSPDSELPDVTRLQAQATQETIDMFLHEIRPLIGEFDVRARQAINDYESTPVHAAVENVRALLSAFEDLRSATASQSREEINLTEVVTDAVDDVMRFEERAIATWTSSATPPSDRGESTIDGGVVEVFLTRDDPVPTHGSPRLLTLILSNAVRNAIEACLTMAEGLEKRVVVSWGTTDTDAWVSVVDSGPGLPAEHKILWEPGRTTKNRSAHRGMGLSIMSQATESMGGTISLQNADPSGAVLEVRWQVV